MARDPIISLLLVQLDQAFEKKSWHGTNLRGSVRGMDISTAARRPSPERHNIWELVLHTAYWKYAVKRRILGEKRGSFPLEGSNWFSRPELGQDTPARERTWKSDVALLSQMHAELIAAVADLSVKDLDFVPKGAKVNNRDLISGIIAHDLYHAGQIQLLKRLQR
jgi:hypothetical protein